MELVAINVRWIFELIGKYIKSREESGPLVPQLPKELDDLVCPDCGEIHPEETNYFSQPLTEAEEREVISGVMETWTNLFEVIKGRKPNFDELNSQYLVSNYALEQANDLMPGLYMMAEGVAAEEGYASPPPWAVRIARGVLLEYISGNMEMVSTVLKNSMPDE